MKWTTVAQIALASMTALSLSYQAASADTTTLICKFENSDFSEDEATTIELNEAQNSVAVHFGAYHEVDPYASIRSRLVGPVPAVFGTDAITFSDPTSSFPGGYALNRLTGVLLQIGTNWRWACHPAQKQF